jgi:hypothetical protein
MASLPNQDSNIKFKDKEEDLTLTSKLIRIFHFIYAVSIVSLISLIWKINDFKLFLLTMSISVPLIIDNMRYGWHFSDDIQIVFSYIAFFSHEAITPFGIMYIVAVLSNFVSSDTNSYLFWSALSLSVLYSYLGFRRYLLMSDWKMVSYHGLRLCRPSHTSHAALIPIFATVFGLIASGIYSYKISQEQKYFILFISQLIVFVGNGLLGGKKVLFALFANLFEVIWLWSIIQSL